jgi:hypothetical protein
MLRTSLKVHAMPAGPARLAALDHLFKGQSNDCYWHGLFGGIYISHMRLATYEHLIAAEDAADREARVAGALSGPDGVRSADVDLDGLDEVILATPGQVVVVKPSEGAGIGSWDVRAVRHALAAVLRRRPEASHATLVEHERASSGQGSGTNEAAGVGSIHDRVATKEAGLAGRLHYDAYERRSGLVHVLPAATTPGEYARAEFEELADFVDAPYRVLEAVTAGAGGHVLAARNGHVRTAAGPVPALVEKRIEVAGDRRSPTLTLEVGLENLGATPITGLLAVEWATTMLGGGANPAAYYILDGERVPHDSTGSRAALTSLRSGNDYVGLDVTTEIAPAAEVWIAPIETISNSEAGFERVYQGSALVLTWPLDLAAGARMSVRVSQVISTSRDRAEEEGL